MISFIRRLLTPKKSTQYGKLDEIPYVPRDKNDSPIKELIADRKNIVIFGPPRQGKTSLLKHHIKLNECIYIECNPTMKRSNIYRLILSALGYSITTEKKLKSKSTFKIIGGTSGFRGETGAEDESERSIVTLNVDLKNAPEVAHLISRAKIQPFIIFNNFNDLGDGTQFNLLCDLSFFAEISSIRYIVIGSWLHAAYLEDIGPAISGKVSYIEVPYWDDDDLVTAHTTWVEHGYLQAHTADVVPECIGLSNGDISLFAELLTLSQSISTNEFRLRAQQLAVARSMRGIEKRLSTLLESRDFAITYKIATIYQNRVKNKMFKIPPPGHNITTMFDKNSGMKFSSPVSIDEEGNTEYNIANCAKLEERSAHLIQRIISLFYARVQSGKDSLSIMDIIDEFIKNDIYNAINVDRLLLAQLLSRIADTQKKERVIPPIFSLGRARRLEDRMIHIVDRRFFLALKFMPEDEFEEWLEDCMPNTKPKPRKRSNISLIPVDEEEIIKARAVNNLPNSTI